MKENLEEMAMGSDEIASRLSPEIIERIRKIENAEPYAAGTICFLGMVAAGAIGNYFGLSEVPFFEDDVIRMATYVVGGLAAGIPIGLKIEDIIKKRRYQRLEEEFPEQSEDIERYIP